MPRIDLHTHSVASPDGALTVHDYTTMLASGKLNYIAVTDHDRIDFATRLRAELGPQIIVGQEVTTRDGEIIGLYLHRKIRAGLSARETAERIRAQGGVVYVPHPFETVRKGVTEHTLSSIADLVDIIETHNGRALQNRGRRAAQWAHEQNTAQAASSDAHGRTGWGKTCSIIDQPPSATNLAKLLQAGQHDTRSVGVIGRLYPKLNRLRRKHHA